VTGPPIDPRIRRLARVAGLLLVLAVIGALSVGNGGGQRGGGRPSALGELLWVPQFMAGTQHYRDDELQTMARDASVLIVLQDAVTAKQVDDLRASRPGTRVLVYVNASFAQRGQATAFPPSWYARDAAGQPVTSRQYQTFLMAPGEVGWDDAVADRCRTFVKRTAADGCFLDTLGTGPLEDPEYLSAVPVDPATGRALRVDTWAAGATRRVTRVRDRNPRLALIGNFLRDGIRYARNRTVQEPLLQALDGAMAETWLRDPGQAMSRFPTFESWRADIDLVTTVQGQHREALLVTKAWAVGDDAVRRQWHDFALASFLLVTDGTSRFSFLASSGPDAVVRPDPWGGLAIGRPDGALENDGAVFRRRFTHGTVFVNPSNSSAEVRLSSAGYASDGTRLRQFTMAPHTGMVVVDDKPGKNAA
jgi:hypothetical protein